MKVLIQLAFLKSNLRHIFLASIAAFTVILLNTQLAAADSAQGVEQGYRYFFHWSDKESNDQFLQTLDSQGRLTDRSVKFLGDAYIQNPENAEGQGFYVSSDLFDSQKYGEHLLIVKMKVGEIPFGHLKALNDAASTKKLRDQLPLVFRYTPTWHVMPRAYLNGDPDFTISSKLLGEYYQNYFKSLESLPIETRGSKGAYDIRNIVVLQSALSQLPEDSEKRKIYSALNEHYKNIGKDQNALWLEITRSATSLFIKPEMIWTLDYIKTQVCDGNWQKHKACEDLKSVIDSAFKFFLKSSQIQQMFTFFHVACERGYFSGENCDSIKSKYKALFLSGDSRLVAIILEEYVRDSSLGIDLREYFDLNKMIDSNCSTSAQLYNCYEILYYILYKPSNTLSFQNLDKLISELITLGEVSDSPASQRSSFFNLISENLVKLSEGERSELHAKHDKRLGEFFAKGFKEFTKAEDILLALDFSQETREAALTRIFDSSSSFIRLLESLTKKQNPKLTNRLREYVMRHIDSMILGCETAECLTSAKITVLIRDFMGELIRQYYYEVDSALKNIIPFIRSIGKSNRFYALVVASLALKADEMYMSVTGQRISTEKIIKRLSLDLGFKNIETPTDAIREFLILNSSEKKSRRSEEPGAMKMCGESF